MAQVKIVNNLPRFAKHLEGVADTLLSAMGVDVIRLSKQQVPVDQGQLSASGLLDKVGHLHYRIKFNKKYAAYQHRGSRRDGSRVVRNYSYPGRKKNYLLDPAKTIWGNRRAYQLRYLQGVKA